MNPFAVYVGCTWHLFILNMTFLPNSSNISFCLASNYENKLRVNPYFYDNRNLKM